MKTRKFFAVMAAAAMCVSLAAGPVNVSAAADEAVTGESLLNGYYETVEGLESCSYTLVMDMDVAMNLFGFYQTIDMDILLDIATYGDNTYADGSMRNSALQDGEETVTEQAVEQYVMMEDSGLTVYTCDKETGTWTKWATEKPAYSLDMIPKLDAADFTLEEEDDQYVLAGKVDIMKTIEAMPDMLSGLATGFTGLGELTGDVDITYVFDKESKALTNVKIDMAPAMKAIMEQSMAELGAAYSEAYANSGAEGSEEVDVASLFSADFNSFAIEIKDMIFNQGSEIVLPEEAKDAVAIDEDDYEAGLSEDSTVSVGTATVPKG